MKRHNFIFKRILSSVMALVMLLPFLTVLFPVLASAAEEIVESGMPTVSLSWDKNSVTVENGVALPHRNASATATSYTMKYTVTASGNITEPITVRVQSFDLSAKGGKEYAVHNSTVTLTAQSPVATGSVTVYTHDGYATRVKDTGRVYTNEFGLRITEIKHAKKQSGADTLRAQVLAANGYTLDVVKNTDGANYASGVGNFADGYVYEGMERDYEYAVGSLRVAADGGNDWYTSSKVVFNPMELFQNDIYGSASTMKSLMNLYGDRLTLYFSGYSSISDDASINTKGFEYKVVRMLESGNETVVNRLVEDTWSWNDYVNAWLVCAEGENLVKATRRNSANLSTKSSNFVRLLEGSYKFSARNLASLDLYKTKDKNFDNHLVVMAADNTPVTAESFYVEDRAYGAGDTVYLTVRFNKPVQFEGNAEHPLLIQAKIGGSTANYFTYCGGSMTDTLIFSMTLPEDEEIHGESIELIEFDNEDYNKKLGDMFWNTSNKNNMWVYNDQNDATIDTLEDALIKGKTVICSVDTRTPSISIRDVVGNDKTVTSASFTATVSSITSKGRIDVAWSKSQELPTTEDAWSPLSFLASDRDMASVSVEKKGLTGTYYAHVRATSVSGKSAYETVGPFVFDNQSPTISGFRLATNDYASKYLKSHTVFFDVADVSVGVGRIYMKAHRADGSLGLAGNESELLVYDATVTDNVLSIADGVAQLSVSADMLNLAENEYGAYILEFYAVDALGNQSDVYQFPEALRFDQRDTFALTLTTPSNVSIMGKEIYYNGRTLTFAHSESSANPLTVDSLTVNGISVIDAMEENGLIGASVDGAYELTLASGVQGYLEIVLRLGDRYSNVLNFYVTGTEVASPNYQSLYAPHRQVINEVWQLSTDTFYSGSERNGSYYTGTNLRPIFSSREKALEYAVFFEKQDVVIEHIDNEVEKNNLELGQLNNYRKASADLDKVVAVGQTWLRYKSDTWTLNANNEEQWVYYFYSEERETVIDPALTPALNAAIDRNARLICGYSGDNRIYLTANNTAKGYINDFSEPYYDVRGILTQALSYQGIYTYEIGISADGDIYDSFITKSGTQMPLVANYTFRIDAEQHGFVYYRQQGSENWQPIANGENLKNKTRASGIYEICEFGNGFMTYPVYVDLDAPVLSYELTVDGESKNGHVTSASSGGTLRASQFKVKGIVTEVSGSLPTENDRYAYFYVLYTSLGGGEYTFLTMQELNRGGCALETGIYRIYACDRLGNTTVQTVKINTEELKVEGSIDANGLTVTSNRKPEDILTGSFSVYRDNMRLDDVTYAQSMSFERSGEYRIVFEDVYGNKADKTFTFTRKLPEVTFLREKKAGAGLYETITVNSEDLSALASVRTLDHQIFTVNTSSKLRISYPVSSGYGFEFVGGTPNYDSAVLSTSNIDIAASEGNWMLKIFYKNDPDVYILVTCIVDETPPVISGTVLAREYTFNEGGEADNVLFRGTGSTTAKAFYNGERAVGDAVRIAWSDETQISRVSYTRDGGTPVELSKDLTSVELTEVGSYVFEVSDIYGNTATFAYDFTDRMDFTLHTGDRELEIKRDPESYIVGDGYTDTVYSGKETRLSFREEAMIALYYTDGAAGHTYRLMLSLAGDSPLLYLLVFDMEAGDFVVAENGEIALSSSGNVLEGELKIDYTYQNGIFTLILPECKKNYELWQMRVSDVTGHCPVIVQLERSDRVASMELVKEDGKALDLSYDGYVGSNQILTLNERAVSEDATEIVAYYSKDYTATFEGAERILLYGKDATPFLDREGYYRIVTVNKYGNERVYFVAIRFRLSIDAHLIYEAIDGRVQMLDTPDAYSLLSNKSVRLVIWDERATVTCKKAGATVDASLTKQKGYLEFTLSEIGEYTVVVRDESANTYTLTVSIQAPKAFAYGNYLTGFNEQALKKDEGYTNGALTLDKTALQAANVKYVAFRKAGTEQFSVLYDLIGVLPTEYTQAEYNGIIGKEDGAYEVLFCDAYGNACTKVVRISKAPMLFIHRKTQSQAEAEAYDFEFALQNGAWSNNLLTFTSTSERYLLKINGEAASFGESGYTLTLPADLGTADREYLLEYVDDYGNSYSINVHLHRSTPESWISESADTVSSAGKTYVRRDLTLTWSERVYAYYSLNGGATNAFEMDKVFTEDGEYTFTFVDYAGNVSTRTVIKDSTVRFTVACDANGIHTGAIVSSKVTLSPDEALTFTVTRNGEEYDGSTRTFTEDGHYVLSLTDGIGNVETFTFTLYAKAKQSFALAAPTGYSFSQVWLVKDGYKLATVSDVKLNESGVQTYDFSADGTYEIELLHTESKEICYFTLVIDNAPPEVQLIGAENGGVTRSNVTLAGLCSGDTIYVYKDGEYLTAYIVEGNSETSFELLGNGDFGSYSVIIEDEAGNTRTFEFVKEFATNTYSNVFICLLLISLGGLGIIYIRFNGKVRTK